MSQASVELPSSCDVVIIGGGMGGLTCGAMLAKAGLSVCVLEAERRPGGFLAGFRRGDFVFDTAIHWLNQCGPDGFTRRIFDVIGPGAPETKPQKRIRRYKGDSFDYLLTDNPDQLRDQWLSEFPDEAAGIRRFFYDARHFGQLMMKLGGQIRIPDTMSFWERLRQGARLSLLGLGFIRYLGKTEPGLERYFRRQELRRVFCSEEALTSCLAPFGWAYTRDYQLPPEGGSMTFPLWLTRMIEGWGGVIGYGCRVTDILVADGRAAGVKLLRGRHRLAEHTVRAKYVIAACDLASVFEKLLPAGLIKKKMVDSVGSADLYDSSVTLSIALDVPTQQLGFGEELIFLTRDDVSRADHNNTDPEKAGISILAPSLRDPTLAPPGKGTLTIYANARIDYGNYWGAGETLERGKEYKAFKQRYADVLIDRVQRALSPELTQHIEFCDIATPLTHLRYTGNRAGSIMAQKPTGRNIRRRAARYTTPVQNLFIGGHWAEYGGGVPIAARAGCNSALLVLEREKPGAFASLCDALDGHVSPHDMNPTEFRALPVPQNFAPFGPAPVDGAQPPV